VGELANENNKIVVYNHSKNSSIKVNLYCVDGENSSLYKTIACAPVSTTTIYEGVKIDLFWNFRNNKWSCLCYS
jgi:hypothetical protein